jgi:hypothetical protein
MTSSANCNICANCVKNCPNASIQLTLRPPSKELWFIRKPKLEEAFLSAVIMGIVFVQNVTMLEAWPPMLRWLENAVGTTSYYVTFSIAFLISMLIPISLLGGASWIAKKFNGESLTQNFARFGYALIVLDMAGHIAHNLFHLLAEGKAILFTGLALIGQGVGHGVSTALMDPAMIQMLQFGLIGLGFLGSLYTAYRIAKAAHSKEKVWGTFVPYAVLMIILGVINVYLFVLPMAMRM